MFEFGTVRMTVLPRGKHMANLVNEPLIMLLFEQALRKHMLLRE
jgi:hypothetical protein